MAYSRFEEELNDLKLEEEILDPEIRKEYKKMIKNNEDLPDDVRVETDFKTNSNGSVVVVYTFYRKITDNESIKERIEIENMKSLKKIARSLNYFRKLSIVALALFLAIFFITMFISCT
jgi:Asp-tRNA(Asn)/Glu-tRNA(Gln) amidotransferase B subunit